MDDEIRQEGNVVSGDQAGRDIHKHLVLPSEERQTTMRKLVEEHQKAIENDEEYQGVIESLLHFMQEVDDDTSVSGLQKKLQSGAYDTDLNEAKRLKETFSKTLDRNTFSEASQKIYARVLAEVWGQFNRHVKPAINAGADSTQIECLIYEKIVDPVMTMLDGNTMIVGRHEVVGMLYYLTGNCHLRWD